MLPPVSTVSTANASLAQRDVPVVAQQTSTILTPTPDAAVALSLAANSEVEGKLKMLLIGARERMIDSLFAVVDAVSQSLAMQPAAGESNIGYALRLAAVVNNLPPSEVAAVQQQLNSQGQTAPLALIARALQNPAGNEAAQVVACMEVVRYKEKDLATKAVVASYGQNGGAEEPEASPAPLAQGQIPFRGSADGTLTGQSRPPASAGTATQAALVLPSVAQKPESATNAPKPSNPVPVPQSTASPAQMPASAQPKQQQASAASPMRETPTAMPGATPQSTSPAFPTEALKQAVATAAALAQSPKDEAPATIIARPQEAVTGKPEEATTPAGNSTVAASVTVMAARTLQANVNPTTVQPAGTSVTPQSQPATPVATQVLTEVAGLLSAVAKENEVEPLLPLPPQMASAGEVPVPQPQQPQTAPVFGAPLRPLITAQLPQDVQAILKVVVDQLAAAAGVLLRQTMAEVAPVAERVVAQALVADMLDNAELGALPSPDDAAMPARASQIFPAATAIVTESPAEELASLVAFNRLLSDPMPAAQAVMPPLPLQVPLPPSVPFAIGQYLPAEDAVEEDEALHIDRVDAVDDEEQEESSGRQGRGAEEEADTADEQPESEPTLVGAEDDFGAEDFRPQPSAVSSSRPLALPRPAPMEPMGAPVFNLYQRMGGWD